jgi:predicted O-methyltransferase YrrM
MSDLFKTIAHEIAPMQGWTSIPKAQTLAAIIVALKPEISMEIGVWHGRGSIAMALAHREIGKGHVWSIDAWAAEASVEGQVHEADKKHWAQANHEEAYQAFQGKIASNGLQNIVKVFRQRSSLVEPPEGIGLLVIDGNHGPESEKDVVRFASKVKTGGFVYMDDLGWSGGFTAKAAVTLRSMGFSELYALETGAMFQRV